MPRTILYRRISISTNKPLNSKSIEKQKVEIEKYCMKHQMTLVHNKEEIINA